MPDRPLLRRRTAVAGALGGLVALAGGCDTGEDLPDPGGTHPDGPGREDGSASPQQGGTPSDQPEQTPDQALVAAVLTDLGTALGVAMGVAMGARAVPRLRRSVAPLVRAHRAHVLVLDGELPAAGTAEPADLRALLRSERGLHGRLVEAAGRAESGALAKLLASMSASVTQHLLVIHQETARETVR